MKFTKKIKYINNEMYTYAVIPLVESANTVLHTKTEPFDFTQFPVDEENKPIDPKFITISLIETMVRHMGLGLAAPQVGMPYRVFVMGHGNTAFGCFNPEIIESSGEVTPFSEGCLSYKGLFLKIKRPETVNVRYIDMNGQKQERTFTGLTSRVFQHELDHLDGITFDKKVHPLNLEKAKRKVKSNLKRYEQELERYQKQQVIQAATKKVLANTSFTQPPANDKIQLIIPDNKLVIATPDQIAKL